MFDRIRERLAFALVPKAPQNTNSLEPSLNMMLSPFSRRPPRFGTEELLKSYQDMPWLRAVSGKVGQAVGTTQWRLFVVRDENGAASRRSKIQRAQDKSIRDKLLKQVDKNSLEEIEEHPMLELLLGGNDRMSGPNVFATTQIHIDLIGEAFWLLERNGLGVPSSIWPIPPHWVRGLPRRDRPFYQMRLGNTDVDVPMTEVVAFFDSDPYDPYGRGAGIAKALGDELETDSFAAKHLKNFFYNSARPDLIVSADNLKKEETDRLEQKWNEKHQGFWNSFKAHFINRKVDIREIGHNLENLQMTQLRKQERDTIIQVFGIPPEKMGVLSQSNRSTIAASDVFWQRDVIMPRAEAMRTVLQRKLVPMFDDRLILDFESPVVEDAEHELNVMRANPRAFTINEWRSAANRPSLGEEGESFVQDVNQVVVSGSDEDPNASEPSEPDDDSDDDTEEENGVASAGPAAVKQTFKISSIAGRKSKWSSRQAFLDWARNNGFRTDKVDETKNFWRLRQRDPNQFESLRTICINPNDEDPGSSNCRVQAVGGPLKELTLPKSGKGVDRSLLKRKVEKELMRQITERLASKEERN